MIPPLQYFAPRTLKQASELLLEWGPRARLLSGGTALLPALERRQVSTDTLINVKTISGMRELDASSNGVRIGALVSLTELSRSQVLRKDYPVLPETISVIATPQVRNTATLGGNLCVGTPTADLSITLLALDANVILHGISGERVLPLTSFYRAWGGTNLEPGEILTAVEIPLLRGSARYRRFMVREAVDVPLVNFAVLVESSNDSISRARIVLGGSGNAPSRMIRAENALVHQPLRPEMFEHAIELILADAFLADDARASRDYRRHLLAVLLRRTFADLS